MRQLSMTPHAIKMRERRKKMKVEGIESQPRHDCLCTLREIAEYWGVSTARAGQIERMAFDKLREGLADVWEDYCDRQQSTRSRNTGSVLRAIPQGEVGGYSEGFARELDEADDGSD